MALHVPKAPGFAQMLKEGAKHYAGLEEAVYRNIAACVQLSKTTRSAFGPNGMNKMVINHLEKIFVTNDAATMLKELDVEHPAAKMLVFASKMQEQEAGDGTNWVLMFAGALLEHSEQLLKMGLSVPEVVDGFTLALAKADEILPTLVCDKVKDLRNKDEVVKAIRSSIMSKQFGNEDFIAGLVAEACISILPVSSGFNVDNIRVCKIEGSGLYTSTWLRGMVFKRLVESDVTSVLDAKIAAYTCPIDIMQTETKGTVLIKSAKELMDYSKGEEDLLEAQIKAIAESGANCIVAGGKVGDMALHFLNKYKIMAVRLMSKFDLRRLCKAVGATPLPKMTPPTPSELGGCDKVYIDELGDTNIVVFKQDSEEAAIATVIVRASTDNIMDDVERAIDDGVNTFKALTRDPQLVPGAGATEIELARRISQYGETLPGLEQYAVKKFGEALEIFPITLAENAGVKSTELIAKLYAEHQYEGGIRMGFDVDAGGVATTDAFQKGILDLHLVKHWGLKFATNAASTVLKVDEIIMAKPAGGPKPPKKEGWDNDED
jgi:T-complex protein 1 subunit theta